MSYFWRVLYAARAAEAAQHQQEIAAKDETIRQQAEDIAYFKDFRDSVAAALCVENEQGPVDPSAIVEAADSTLSQLFDFSARLAAVEAERDALERLRVHCEHCGADYAATGVEARCPCLVRAERDRLKADQQDWRKGVALIASALGDKADDLSCVRIAEIALTLRAALEEAHALLKLFQTCYPAAIASLPENGMERMSAALTPQGQSTDGETR